MEKDPLIGSILSERYEILSELGRGARGAVYKARHVMVPRNVAIKVLFAEANSDSTLRARFLREATLAASVNHANLVIVHDFGFTQSDRPYLVMELLEGENLQDLLSREKNLPIERAVPIFMQICAALNHAHNKGLVHRDLKPGNVVVVETDEAKEFVKIVDFGIAKELAEEHDRVSDTLTELGCVIGTPVYMSPEQCLGRKIDTRSDIYSMGCLMYRTIVGVPAILGDNPLQTMTRHVTDTPLPFKEIVPDLALPKELETIIFRALSKSPADRQQSMAELRESLKEFIRAHESQPTPVSKAVPAPTRLSEDDNTLQVLLHSAKEGNVSAQFDLGNRYRKGEGIGRDLHQSMLWYKLAAERGDARAQFSLAELYESGVGVRPDPEEAVKWYERAALQGHSAAQNALGSMYEAGNGTSRSESSALRWYRESADSGDARGQYNLGRCHFYGIGANVNEGEAVRWYEASAKQSYVLAMIELAYCLQEAVGTSLDQGRAFALLTEAAGTGNTQARNDLARCYKLGVGVPVNLNEAFLLYEESAQEGDRFAQQELAMAYEDGAGTTIDLSKAVYWYRQAAEQGNKYSMFSLGLLHKAGKGVEKSIEIAVHWFSKAAELDHAGAQLQLALCLEIGNGIFRQPERAAGWFEKAAANGDRWAQYELALRLLEGQIVEKDYARALSLFQASADQGWVDAQYELARCFENGIGTEIDHDKALHWYHKAAASGYLGAEDDVKRLAREGQEEAAAQTIIESFAAELSPQKARMYEDQPIAHGAAESSRDSFLRLMLRAADGDADAQLKLAMAYEGGIGVQPSTELAIDWLRKSATLGKAEAQWRLALHLKRSTGETSEALVWLRKAAANEFDAAQNTLGEWLMTTHKSDEQLKEALLWLSRAADKGSDAAQFNLEQAYQVCFMKGILVEDAVQFMRLRAERGNILTMTMLAGYLAQSPDRKKNEEALNWYQRLAELGLAEGEYALGLALIEGTLITKEIDKGKELLGKAAAQGLTRASEALALYTKSEATELALKKSSPRKRAKKEPAETNAGKTDADQTAVKEAAEKGDAMAQWAYAFGLISMKKTSRATALRWFEKSAVQRFGPVELIVDAVDGRGVFGVKFISVFNLFQEWATKKDVKGSFWLAICYLEGKGTAPDREKALQLLRFSAEADYQPAQQLLAEIRQI